METGMVGLSDYWNFVKFSSGCCGVICFFIVILSSVTLLILVSAWLAKWASQDAEEQQKAKYPMWFGLLILFYMISSVLRQVCISYVVLGSSTNMHNKMAERVLRAKIIFFDSNPIGRILTHFSKDMVSIDFVISMLTPVIAYGFFRALSVAVSLCIVNPYMVIPLVLSGIYMYYILNNCQCALVESQRLDGIVRGPIHDKFSMQIIGLVTIRAYRRLEYFNMKYMIENEKSANVTFT